MWAYLASLLAIGAAGLVLLVALLLRYLPHDYLGRAGLTCIDDAGVCAVSLPTWAGPPFAFLMGGIIGGLVLFFLAVLFSQVGCSRRHKTGVEGTALTAGALAAGVPGSGDGDVSWPSFRFSERLLVLENSSPISYTIGFFKPRIVVSTGLREALEDEEVAAVLAHEEAHILGRDNLVILIAESVARTFALVPGTRRAAARLRRAQEIAADEYARQETGDGLIVASGLQKFARSVSPVRTAAVSAFAEETGVAERIWGLLVEPQLVRSRRYLIAVVVGLVLVFSVFAGSAVAFTDVTVDQDGACGGCHMSSEEAEFSSAHSDCCVRF